MPYSTGCFQCRNMAQKQWDETLVLVLGGIARWESLLQFVENSILNGSKEVALAAIHCLQTTVNSHSSKESFTCRLKDCSMMLYTHN
ncbi:protein MON2 homolog [Glycine max]|uniref:protein MON2 homolog n=1 Tax=Glycine max TaxID=3847 RepID=UPI001B3551BB|nr:protein MON2 homolog [Glycine max]